MHSTSSTLAEFRVSLAFFQAVAILNPAREKKKKKSWLLPGNPAPTPAPALAPALLDQRERSTEFESCLSKRHGHKEGDPRT